MSPKVKTAAKATDKKIFVLDTSVILYDHSAVNNFEEHDVVLPIQVIEEIDNFKKGNESVNFEARSFIRYVDDISDKALINTWIPIDRKGAGQFKVILPNEELPINAEVIFGDDKNDNKILNAALSLKNEFPKRRVILVTKDICLRLKAKSLSVLSEDYETGKIKDVQHLYTGRTEVKDAAPELLSELYKSGSAKRKLLNGTAVYDNHYFVLKNGRSSALAHFDPIQKSLQRIDKISAFNIKPKNNEQAFAMHALMNPNIKLVTIQGMSGTGKTLLALAASLEQRRDFRQIFVTRPVITLGNNDIGYLPGDIKSKLDPYMQPIWDNLKIIKDQYGRDDKNYKRIEQMVENEKIMITPLAYIRGRTLTKIYFIIDEAQNLTPHEIKTIISRAGEDTKIIFTGDIYQIDTPYLDAESNGLSYLIDKAKDNPLFAHITLEKGQRSDLANFANNFL
ncbi:MAG: PhoH family protein [Chitinophagales bacterium]|nr:PhoH family protein [Chitinophagales bacterium]